MYDPQVCLFQSTILISRADYIVKGTGKTLLARGLHCANQSIYLQLARPSLVQTFIGDGAKLVRDAFKIAKEEAAAIFIDELDAIGTKRFDSRRSGDRECSDDCWNCSTPMCSRSRREDQGLCDVRSITYVDASGLRTQNIIGIFYVLLLMS